MGILIRALFTITLLHFSAAIFGQADSIKIITHIDATPQKISSIELKNLYMGYSIGQQLEPLALAPGQYARAVFNTRIIGMTESRIQSFWAQMRFSGRTKPPVQFDDVNVMINYIATNKDAIGYVPGDTALPDSVKVIELSL